MKSKRTVIYLSILLILLGVNGPSLAREGHQPQGGGGVPAANLAPWYLDTLDATPDHEMGKYASIAMDPFSGMPHVSYYNETDNELMYAHPVSSGGNCGPADAWLCETVDTMQLSGKDISIAVYNSLIVRSVGIAYVETYGMEQYLRYAHYSCNILNPPCSQWSFETVFFLGRVLFPSLKFDANGEPHIAFYVPGYTSPAPAFNGSLRYASHTTPGGAGWTTLVIQHGADAPGGVTGDNMIGVGLYPSLAFNSSGSPRIAYFGSDYSNLQYAVYVGNNAGSCLNDNWDCQVIDDVEANTGMFPSLAIAQNTRQEGGGDLTYIAYYEQSTGKLKLADNALVDPNCGPGNNTWRCREIADMGILPLSGFYQIHAGLSLALDDWTVPMIAYSDRSDSLAPAGLRLARPAYALGNLTGNCGPMGTWQCSLLNPSPLGEADEADYVSLAVAPNGLGTIAYTEDRTSYSQGWRLNLAYQQFSIFLPTIQK